MTRVQATGTGFPVEEKRLRLDATTALWRS